MIPKFLCHILRLTATEGIYTRISKLMIPAATYLDWRPPHTLRLIVAYGIYKRISKLRIPAAKYLG